MNQLLGCAFFQTSLGVRELKSKIVLKAVGLSCFNMALNIES